MRERQSRIALRSIRATKERARSGGGRSGLLLVAQQRDGFPILGRRNRLQIGVNILEVRVRQNLLPERRHGSRRGANEGCQRLVGQRIGRELGAGDRRPLPFGAVALVAAVFLGEKDLAAGSIRGERSAVTEQDWTDDEA